MSIINKLSSTLVTYSGVNSIRPRATEFHLKAGTFELNGIKIKIESKDTLDTIVKKFNDKKLVTGVSAKKVYIESNRSWKIVLVSTSQVVNIIDPKGVFSDLYKKGLFGTENKCLWQVIPSERLKKTNSFSGSITIKYSLKPPTQPRTDKDNLAGFNKMWLAGLIPKLSGPLIMKRYEENSEISDNTSYMTCKEFYSADDSFLDCVEEKSNSSMTINYEELYEEELTEVQNNISIIEEEEVSSESKKENWFTKPPEELSDSELFEGIDHLFKEDEDGEEQNNKINISIIAHTEEFKYDESSYPILASKKKLTPSKNVIPPQNKVNKHKKSSLSFYEALYGKSTISFQEYKTLKPQQQKEYFMKAKNFLREVILSETTNNTAPLITIDMLNQAKIEQICGWYDILFNEE